MRALVFAALAALSLGHSAAAEGLVEEEIGPNSWSDSPRPVALRCAGLLGIIARQGGSMDALNSQTILLREAVRLGGDEATFDATRVESDRFAEAYLALPETPEVGAILTLDLRSCMAFVTVLRDASQ